jgi:septal ring factor EnvC (AmiA/AmiB activator)
MRRLPFSLLPLPVIALATSLGFAQADTGMPVQPPALAAQDVDAELARVVQELRNTDAQLEAVRANGDVVRQRMMARGRAYYRMTHAGLLPLGAGFDNLMDHTSKVERLRRALTKDAQAAKALNQRQVALLKHQQVLLDRKQPLEMKRSAMAEARSALMEADDRKRAFDRAFASSGPALGDYTAVYGAPADPTDPGAGDELRSSIGGFRSLEGRLPFPLAGRTEVRMVRRRGAGGPGVEMLARPGTAVLAVHTGRVAFADDYGTYGKVVIIDHGEQYFSVCGDLGTIDVAVGNEVGSGAHVGTVGRGVLYFELRHGADTLDPAPWLGL